MRPLYDWTGIDLTRPMRDIMRETGRRRNAIRCARKRYGVTVYEDARRAKWVRAARAAKGEP